MEGNEQAILTKEEGGNRFAKLTDKQVLAAADELGLQIDRLNYGHEVSARVRRIKKDPLSSILLRKDIFLPSNSDVAVYRGALKKIEDSTAEELQNVDVNLEELHFSPVNEWHTSIRDRLQGKEYDVQAKQKTTGRFVTLETRRIKNVTTEREMLEKRAHAIIERRQQEALAKEAELQRAYEKVTISN